MSSALDRESLRAKLRGWPEFQRRIALERVVEQPPDATAPVRTLGRPCASSRTW